MIDRQDIKALTRSEIDALVREADQPPYRANQLWKWIYANGCLSFGDMTSLPEDLRIALAERYFISYPSLIAKQESFDGTRKYLFELSDGARVEAVGMPSDDGSRLSVCFSSQAGCPMACAFCATGRAGFTRNLSGGEMYDQVRFVAEDFGIRVSSVVCMGQGEPFLNYDATLQALKLFNSSEAMGVGARHITLSTCGIVNGILKFSEESEQFTLAVSLHSAIQNTRDMLMPGVAKIPIGELRLSIKVYGEKTRRRPSLEYALIAGINDDDVHLDALIAFCKGMLCHVNLIPLNPIDLDTDYRFAPSPRVNEFANRLTAHGIENSIRRSRGVDIDGACGQLQNRVS